MVAPESLVFQPLVKGNEDSGNESDSDETSLKTITLPRLISSLTIGFSLGLSPGGKIKLIKSSSISLQSPFRFVVVLVVVDLSGRLYSCFRILDSFRFHESLDVTFKITSFAKRLSIPSVSSGTSNTKDRVSSGYLNTEKRVKNTTGNEGGLAKFELFG